MTPRPPLPDDAYRRFFEALPDAAFVIDLETGCFSWVNEAAARLHGCPREALVGAPAREPPSSAESVTEDIEWEGRRYRVGLARDATAREALERELEDSTALLANAFDQSPLAMVVIDPVGRRNVQVNDTFCRMTGYSRAEMMDPAQRPLAVVSEEDRARLAEESQRTGRIAGTQVTLRTKQGTERLVRFWSQFFTVPSGPRAITMAEDVTERVASESARLDALDRLEKIASRVPGVMFQFRRAPDGSGHIDYASAQLASLYEFNQADAVKDPSLAFSRYHPDDLPIVVAALDTSARELAPLTFEARVVLPSHRIKWVAASAVPERDPDGSVTWSGFLSDVTERRRAEDDLAESERRFKFAVEATRDGLFDWNVATDESWTSPTYARMLGYEPGELTFNHETWKTLVHPDDRERVWHAVTRCLVGKQDRYEAEYRLKTRSGGWRWVLSRGQCIERDAQGRGIRLVGTHVDLTEQKELELELAQRDRLANLGLLAAGIAHEVNNPLSWVLANLDDVSSEVRRLTSLAADALGALQHEGLDMVAVAGADIDLVEPATLADLVATADGALEGTHRIRDLSRALGAFSRADQAELEPVDVNVALDTAASIASNELRFRAALVRTLGRVPPVRAVMGKLTQLFLNLLVHTTRSIPEGHVDEHRVTLRSWAEGRWVFVEVSDSAHVLSPDQTSGLFEPKFSTTQGDGSGLELAIARNLVTEFEGAVHVHSEPGEGTRVVVRLPAQAAAEKPAPAPEQTRRGRVLVVDDEPALQRTLARTLRDHDVVTAGSAEEAQALIRRDPRFDVILCDVSMPGMNGPELHAWIQADYPGLAERVVFLTGGMFEVQLQRAVERSGLLRLEKPFEAERLRAIVAERLGPVSS